MPVSTYDIHSDRQQIDVSKKIAEYEVDDGLFVALLARAHKVPTRSTKVAWFDEQPNVVTTKIDGAHADNVTDIKVIDGTVFTPKDIAYIPRTREAMYVKSISGNTLTVTRAYGEIAAAALNDTEEIMCLGNAMEVNSLAPASRIVQPTEDYNYVQEYRTPFDGSWESEDIEMRTMSERKRLTRRKLMEHRRGIERILLWGQRKNDVTGKNRTAAGLYTYVTSNVIDANVDPTEDEFEAICQTAFTFGGYKKLLLASPKMLTILNKYSRDKVETGVMDETYGMRLKYWRSAHGDLVIVPTRTFAGYYAKHSVILDPEYFEYKPFAGHDTTLDRNLQENDRHGWKDEYWTQFTCMVRCQKAHTIITNL